MLVRISDHAADSRQSCNFFGRALRVASSDNDFAIRIFAMNTANGGARVLIGRCGHGASIQNHDLSMGRSFGADHTALLELAFDGGPVGLSGATAKVLDVKTGHDL